MMTDQTEVHTLPVPNSHYRWN